MPHIDDIFKDFTSYKLRVPVTGGIILDETFERVSVGLKKGFIFHIFSVNTVTDSVIVILFLCFLLFLQPNSAYW